MQRTPVPHSARYPSDRVDGPYQHKILMAGAYLIATAIITLALAYLPILAGTILTQLNVVPSHLALVDMSNLSLS